MELVEQERSATDGEGQFLERMFQLLESEDIRYAVLRNYDNLPASANGSDVDIWVHPLESNRAIDLILQAIDEAGGSVIRILQVNGFKKIASFGRNFVTGDWWGICIDVFVGINYAASVKLMGDSEVAECRRKYNGISVLPDGVAGVLGVAKEAIHNEKLPKRYLPSACSAVIKEGQSLNKIFSPIGMRALDILKGLCLMRPEDLRQREESRKLRNAILVEALKKNPLSYMGKRATYLYGKASRYISPPGLVIALLGTDGSGKSTVLNAARPTLDSATHGALRIQHLRPGLLPPLARLKGKSSQPSGPVTDPHGSHPSGVIGSLLRLGYLLTDYILGYWVKVRPVIAKSPTVYLFDRYAYDMEMDPRRFRIRLPTWLLRWATRLAPKPDLVFCLDGDPEVIASRKKELPLEEVRRQVQFLRDFAAREPNAVLISTDCSVEETRDQVLEALLEYCRARNPLPSET